MKFYQYNDRINFLEIDPSHLYEGLKFAKENKYFSIRIKQLIVGTVSSLVDIKELSNLDKIQRLDIQEDVIIPQKLDLEPIYSLKQLREFYFENKNIKPDFSKLTQLDNLCFKYHKGIKNLSSLKNLKDLLIFSLNMPNCEILSELLSLEKLRLTRGSFNSLQGIENLKNIKKLKVTYNTKLNDAKALISLPELENLHIEKCKNLTDFSFLKGNPYIKELFIDTLNSLDFIPTMPNLEKIKFWNCIDGNMQPLLESKNLKEIYFYPNKKHYTHTVEEIKEIYKEK